MTSVRRMPRWQITLALKKKRVRQMDIAQRSGCSDSFVNKVISRQYRGSVPTVKAEKVWRALEEVLG